MAWSIAEVARMSGVTSRTLRHDDQLGLLAPAYVGSNGYRWYEQEQRLLLLRELGLGLAVIGEVLDGQRDQVAALRRNESELRAERARPDRLSETVSRTIRHLTGGDAMSGPELFEGFAERQAQDEAELVERHGGGVREHFRTAREATRDWSREDGLAAQRRWEELDERVLAVLRSGAAPDSPAALEVLAAHHAEIARYWTPDRASCTGLGRTYVDDPQFRQRYDALAPGLAAFLRDATAAYAARQLS